MKCHDFELQVRDLLSGKRLTREEQALLDHAQRCKSCERRLQDTQQLESELARMAQSFQSVTASLEVREELRQEFRRETQAGRQLQAGESRKDRTPHWLLAAAALLLALLTGGLFYTTRETAAPEMASLASGQSQRPATAPAAATHQSGAGTAPEQMYSEFIPISSCRSTDCLDQARMMRIDLPRSSVSYFGIPKARIRTRGDRIKADVLVGEDGIARAIRFVY